jgi:Zn-dependent oligopeptidase
MLRVLLENKIISKSYRTTGIDILKKSQNFNDETKIDKNASFTKIKECISSIIEDNTILLTFNSLINYLSEVHPEKEIRIDSLKLVDLFSSYINKINRNKNMYRVLENIINNKYFNKLTEEEQYFIKKLKNGYVRSGVLLGSDIKILRKKINQSINNINEDINRKKIFGLDPKELLGLPEEIKALYFEVDKNLNRVGCYLNQYIFDKNMSYIIEPNIRRKLEYLYYTRGLNNLNTILSFKNLLLDRHEYATKLNFNSYVEYKNANSMISDPVKIVKLLNILNKKIHSKYLREINNMLRLKKKLCSQYNLNFDGTIASWDVNLLIKQWKIEYGTDDEELKKYFILKRTVPKILATMGEIFNLVFNQIKKDAYHKKVSIFEVCDADSKEVLGFIYFDLFQREGKNNLSNCYPIQPSVSFPYDEKQQKSIVAVVENFPPDFGFNYELNISELFQLINRIGQSIQLILTKFKTPLTSVGTERDCDKVFTFIIKHLFNNIEIIRNISTHKDTRKPLDDEIISKIIRSRKVGSSIFYKKQILTCLFDNFIHSSSKFYTIINNLNNDTVEILKKTTELYNTMYDQIFDKNTIIRNEGIFPPITWNHIYDGHETLYHGYIISEIIACDIIHSLFKKNKSYIEIGQIIKNELLPSLSIRNAVNKILGREFTIHGFIELNELANYSNESDSIFIPEKNISSIKNDDIGHKDTFNSIESELLEERSNYYIEHGLHSCE